MPSALKRLYAKKGIDWDFFVRFSLLLPTQPLMQSAHAIRSAPSGCRMLQHPKVCCVRNIAVGAASLI